MRSAAFVAGAWWLQQQAQLPSVLWALALPPLACVLALLPARCPVVPRAVWRVCWIAWWAGAGFAIAAAWAQVRLADDLPPEWEGRDLRLRGVVAEMPQAGPDGTQRFVFEVEAIATPSAHAPARVALSWYPSATGPRPPAVVPGERWQLTVRLKRPHATANPHSADMERWYLERGIRAVGYVRPARARRVEAQVPGAKYAIERVRARMRARLEAALHGLPEAGVLAALTIGDQQSIARDQWEVFTATGVNHLMSISGLHITMLAGIGFALTRRLWSLLPALPLRVPAKRAATAAGLGVGMGYALLAGFAVPAQRTVLMMAVAAVALWRGTTVRGRDVLALAAMAVVARDPWSCMSPGFWLSFSAVAIILYVGVGRLGPSNWLAQWGRVQWAITLGLMPVLLALFHQVSLISPLANAVAIPLVSLGVVPLALAGLALPGDLLLGAAAQTLHWTWWLLQAMAELPLATIAHHAVPTWALASSVAGIVLLLGPRGMPARWLGASAVLPLLMLPAERPPKGEAWLDVLDVGQGQAVLVRTRAHALLYDAGPAYRGEADAGARVVVPHLRAIGVQRLDALVVSHDDRDHSGGAGSVLAALPVGRLLSSARGLGEPCTRGQQWEWDGVQFQFLHPDAADYNRLRRDNDVSCVLRVRAGRRTALLTGDIEAAAERRLMRRGAGSIRADVLLVPHHGSATSSAADFLRHVQPSIAIFTVGHRNRFGHPAPQVLQRYAQAGARVYRSDRDGALRVDLGEGATVRAWRRMRARYWQGR